MPIELSRGERCWFISDILNIYTYRQMLSNVTLFRKHCFVTELNIWVMEIKYSVFYYKCYIWYFIVNVIILIRTSS